jgi:hypothetical protein
MLPCWLQEALDHDTWGQVRSNTELLRITTVPGLQHTCCGSMQIHGTVSNVAFCSGIHPDAAAVCLRAAQTMDCSSCIEP